MTESRGTGAEAEARATGADGTDSGPEKEFRATRNYSQALKPNGICSAGFQNCRGPVTPGQ